MDTCNVANRYKTNEASKALKTQTTYGPSSLDHPIRYCMCTYWEAYSCRCRIHRRRWLQVNRRTSTSETTTHPQTSAAVTGSPAIAALSCAYVGNIARDVLARLCVHNSVSRRTVDLAYTRGPRARRRHVCERARANTLSKWYEQSQTLSKQS